MLLSVVALMMVMVAMSVGPAFAAPNPPHPTHAHGDGGLRCEGGTEPGAGEGGGGSEVTVPAGPHEGSHNVGGEGGGAGERSTCSGGASGGGGGVGGGGGGGT